MKRFWFSLLLACALSAVALQRTDGFSSFKLSAVLEGSGEEAIEELVHEILTQKFFYFSKGRQSFVFASEDGKYVLKSFNQSYLKMPWHSFLFYRKEKEKRDRRRFFFENSYAIALKELGEEILYLHMKKTKDLPRLDLVARDKSTFSIDLNKIAFVLQKKGEPFYPTLQHIYRTKGKEALQEELKAFLKQVEKRIEKGIADADSDIKNNWGYVDGKIFHLDPGRLYYDPDLKDPQRKKEEWERSTRSLKKWLKKEAIFFEEDEP